MVAPKSVPQPSSSSPSPSPSPAPAPLLSSFVSPTLIGTNASVDGGILDISTVVVVVVTILSRLVTWYGHVLRQVMERTSSGESGRAPSPRQSFKERFLHTLPSYTGPYAVGFFDMELPARVPRPFSHIKRNHEHALKLDTVLFSVYHPADLGPDQGKGLARAGWLPSPRIPTTQGYAKFLNIPRFPVTAYIACTSMFTKLPAFRNAQLASHWPRGTERPGQPRFPVVIFSHGLGGSRTAYSAVCGELASFGFVVVAMEHRDGSGARTYVNKKGASRDLDSQSLDRSYDAPQQEEEGEDERAERAEAESHRPKHRRDYYKVDYMFPKDNAQDTSPHNARGVDTELRGAQIDMRLAEVDEAYRILGLLNEGEWEQVVSRNLRKAGNIGSSSRGLDGIEWEVWKHRLYLDKVTMMGHSFGGATTVQACRLDERFPWISSGILLDAWGPATPDSLDMKLCKPILSIGSEAFMHWKENYDRIEHICNEGRERGVLCWMTTIRGSTHLSQTDFAVLYPLWMSLLMKTLVHPQRAIYLTIHSALEFLKVVLPRQQTRFQTAWTDEQLLRKASTESDISVDHRPDDKWIAARLKIRNEFAVRLRARMARMAFWQRADADGLPRDAAGRPLHGLMNWGKGKEIWVHLSPQPAEVEDYMARNHWPSGRPHPYAP